MAESQGPASGVPARGYSWPPFEPGNDVGVKFEPGHERSLQHGAYSPRKVDPLARELVEAVLADPNAQHAHAAHHRPALWSWARAQAQIQLVEEYLARRAGESGEELGDLEDERVRSAYLLLHRAEARASTWSKRLGLDPLSQSQMRRNTTAASWDMAKIMGELHRRDEEAAGGAVAAFPVAVGGMDEDEEADGD